MMRAAPHDATSRLAGLDGCRAIAIAIVVAYHAGAPVPGDLGVQFFFVLSGFLITTLLLREYRNTGTIDRRAFYVRRILRIVPAYVTFLCFSLALDTVLGDRWSAWQLVAALTYTVNYYNAALGHPTTSIAHAWSLAIEEQFYLLWPVVLVVVLKRKRSLPIILTAAIAAVCAWRSIAYLYLGTGPAYVYNAFETRFDSLATGCLLAALSTQPQVSRALDRMARYSWLPLVVAALIAASRTAAAAYHYSLGFSVDALLMAVFLSQMIRLSATPAWRWLEAPAARLLGALSYSLYLYHLWGLSIGKHLGGLVPGIAMALGLAAGSYYVIEAPFLRMKERWSRQGGDRSLPATDRIATARGA